MDNYFSDQEILDKLEENLWMPIAHGVRKIIQEQIETLAVGDLREMLADIRYLPEHIQTFPDGVLYLSESGIEKMNKEFAAHELAAVRRELEVCQAEKAQKQMCIDNLRQQLVDQKKELEEVVRVLSERI